MREGVEMCHLRMLLLFLVCTSSHFFPALAEVQKRNPPSPGAQKVIIDTDIGDDIDDAFALALALRSPELDILQVNSDFGNTPLRTRLLERYLDAVGRSDLTVATGVQTPMVERNFTQRAYADREKPNTRPTVDAVTSTLAQIREHPGEITLLTIGPLVNVEAMIDKDLTTFRKLKRVVMMGGSIATCDGTESNCDDGTIAEWNILQDIHGAQKLFTSGVSIYMMPLNSTRLKLDEVKRAAIFDKGTALTDQLAILYQQWGGLTPTLYDGMPVAYAIQPHLCPTKLMRIDVDAAGYTRVQPGASNANVCLHSDSQTFFEFYMSRLISPEK